MAKSKGWIKIERDIVDHWVFQDPEYFRAWVLMLLMANHEDAKILINKELVTIPRGAFHSSILILAGKLGWTRKRTNRYIQMLEMDEMLTTKRTTHGATFFVENYSKYQGQGTTKVATDDTTEDTTDDTPDDTQTRMKKNIKNVKKRAQRASAWKSYDEKVAGMTEAMQRLAEKEGS